MYAAASAAATNKRTDRQNDIAIALNPLAAGLNDTRDTDIGQVVRVRTYTERSRKKSLQIASPIYCKRRLKCYSIVSLFIARYTLVKD